MPEGRLNRTRSAYEPSWRGLHANAAEQLARCALCEHGKSFYCCLMCSRTNATPRRQMRHAVEADLHAGEQ